ncbi:holo-ACP synthase [Treponema zioleckii]|uniref:holo-ACP synthase n=1 Tax=Treponema zioleckii TaxID=331680 RepID=UPI00168B52F6|nr:holo-ACP synthase [Treponema zioleckii]
MIFGIGTDISKVSRFEKWVKNPVLIKRFFNAQEIVQTDENSEENLPRITALCEHYAGRFSAKEAFCKALGTGFTGLELGDFFVKNDKFGKPYLELGEKTKKIVRERVGENYRIHLSISHEKEFAIAFVVIEN